MTNPTTTAAIALAALLSGTASAADNDDRGVIFGVGLGQTKINSDDDSLGVPLDFQEETSTYKLFAGWRFNQYIAVEAAYIDPQSVSKSYSNGSGDVLKLTLNPEVWQATVVGTVWLNDTFNLYGRVGQNWYEDNAKVTFDGVPLGEASGSDQGLTWGVGVGALWDKALFRLEYEAANFDGGDTSQVSLSMAWRL